MTLKDKLQIILITYNRERALRQTLKCLLDNKSPVREVAIYVLDNKSPDGTKAVVRNLLPSTRIYTMFVINIM